MSKQANFKDNNNFVPANIKITKGQVEQARALGITHVNFHNKGLQKRLKKIQDKILKGQERRENHAKKFTLSAEKARKVVPPGRLGHFTEEETKELAMKIMQAPTRREIESEAMQTLADGMKLSDGETSQQAALRVMNVIQDTINDIPPQPGPLEEVGTITYDDHEIETDNDSANFGVQHVDHFKDDFDKDFARDSFANYLVPHDFRLSDKHKVIVPELKENQALINLYGTKDVYKPIPENGDYVLTTGVVAAIRTFEKDKLPTNEELRKLQEIDFVNDKVIYLKLQNHGISGACIDFKSPMYNANAHSLLTSACRASSIWYPEEIAVNPEQLKGWISTLPPHMVDMVKYTAATTLRDVMGSIKISPETLEDWLKNIGDDSVLHAYPGVIDWEGLLKKIEKNGGGKHTHASDLEFRAKGEAEGISYEGNTQLDNEMESMLTNPAPSEVAVFDLPMTHEHLNPSNVLGVSDSRKQMYAGYTLNPNIADARCATELIPTGHNEPSANSEAESKQ